MPSSTAELLDALQRNDLKRDVRPWGMMDVLSASDVNLTVKYISIALDARTSLQYHEHKDELLIIIEDFSVVDNSELGYPTGFITVDGVKVSGRGSVVRIKPNVAHRVTGPMLYLEISTFDDDTDTIRIEDDYERVR